MKAIDGHQSPAARLWASLLMTAVLLLVHFYGSVLLALLLKKMAGPNSRWLIGW